MITSSGIYAIQRKDSAECYIGSAVDVSKRWREHGRDLLNGKHHSLRLQRVHDKHGMGALEFVFLEPVADRADLLAREQVWLDKFSPAYNTALVAGSPMLGLKHSAESRARMSEAHKGVSDETRRRISVAATGRRHSAETRQKMSVAGKARPPFSAEHCAKLSAVAKARPPISDATRQRISLAGRGRKLPPFSAEHRERLSVVAKARRFSDETRARMSVAQKARQLRAASIGNKQSKVVL